MDINELKIVVVPYEQCYPWLFTEVHWPWTCNSHPKQHNSGKCVFSYDPSQHTAQHREGETKRAREYIKKKSVSSEWVTETSSQPNQLTTHKTKRSSKLGSDNYKINTVQPGSHKVAMVSYSTMQSTNKITTSQSRLYSGFSFFYFIDPTIRSNVHLMKWKLVYYSK